jgi:hypothetical protein
VIDRRTFIALLGSAVIVQLAEAQQATVYRVGVVLEGGPNYAEVAGLKDGLKELGFAEGKQYVLEIRDLKGDRKAVEAAARSLEREKVNLIYSLSTFVTTAVKRATTEVPIVFAIGSDPVVAGLVESFAKPGGRLTGVHFPTSDLTAKRLGIQEKSLRAPAQCVSEPGSASVVKRLLFGTVTGRCGSRAPIRFLKQRPFDQLFCAWGHQSLSAHFVDFFTAVATTSNVCSALTPVIPDVRFLGHERQVLAG